MFNEEILSLGLLMNKSHRNSTTVHVRDGIVTMINGDGTLVVRYPDPKVGGLTTDFYISDYPDSPKMVKNQGDKVKFIVEKGKSRKTIFCKRSEECPKIIDDLFDSLSEVKNFRSIPKESIDLLDDETFFKIEVSPSKVRLSQFNGYSGKISIIESHESSLFSFANQSSERGDTYEIGAITDIFKLLYSFFDHVEFYFEREKCIYAKAKKGSTFVRILISDASWNE